jgi:hypothetical protein
MAQLSKGETFTDVSPGKTVTSSRLNNHVDGAVLLNGAVLDQTEKAVTVPADMVLLGDSTLPASAAPRKVQLTNLLPEIIRQGVQQYVGTDSGGANAYVVALSPAATAYTAGMVVRFKAANANTGASTLNVNGLGLKNIYTRAGTALAANDILAGQVCECVYDGTQFQLMSALGAGQVTAAQSAEANRQGVHQYAVDGGAANAYAVTLTPAATAYTAGMVVRFKAANANTGASTLNVNGLGAKDLRKVVAGAVAALAARDVQVADLVEAVYDGTQFLLTSRVRSWDFVSADTNVPAASANVDIAHGLGAVPNKLHVVLVQTDATARNGYAQNDQVELLSIQGTTNSPAFAVSADATNVTIARSNNTLAYMVPKGGGAPVDQHANMVTNTYFKIRVYASL